jgi:hypothetical protein
MIQGTHRHEPPRLVIKGTRNPSNARAPDTARAKGTDKTQGNTAKATAKTATHPMTPASVSRRDWSGAGTFLKAMPASLTDPLTDQNRRSSTANKQVEQFSNKQNCSRGL